MHARWYRSHFSSPVRVFLVAMAVIAALIGALYSSSSADAEEERPSGGRSAATVKGSLAGSTGGVNVVTASVSGYEVIESAIQQALPSDGRRVTAVCPTGKRAMGGGFSSGAQGVELQASVPENDGRGWRVNVFNRGTSPAPFRAYAVCVRLG